MKLSPAVLRYAISTATLLAFAILLFVLHGAQPLAVNGPPRNPAGFDAIRRTHYLVELRGIIDQPITLSLRDARGDLLSNEIVAQPSPDKSETARAIMLKARANAKNAHLLVTGHTHLQITLQTIDENAPRRKWIASVLFLVAFATFCAAHWSRNWIQALAMGAAYFLPLLPFHTPAFFSNSGDNRLYVPTGLSLIERGDWNVDEFRGSSPDAIFRDDYFVQRGTDGHYYNLYPPGTTILALPIICLGDWLFDRTSEPLERANLIAELAAKIISAASVALFYLVAFWLIRRRAFAAILACVFAFATPQFSTHGGGLWSHNSTVFCSLCALALWVWNDGRRAAWSSLPLAFGMISRPTMIIPTAVFAVALLLRDRRQFAFFVGGILLAMILFVRHSLGIWGQLLPPYYTGHATVSGAGALAFLGTLVSPNRGLFIYCPLAVFAVVGGVIAWREGSPAIYRMAGIVSLFEWILASHNDIWWGGHCYGPRLLAEAVPFLTLLLIPAWKKIELSNARRAFIFTGIIAAAWGFFVQLQAMIYPQVYQWNARPNVDQHPVRLWDWNDWQILAAQIGRARLTSRCPRAPRVPSAPL